MIILKASIKNIDKFLVKGIQTNDKLFYDLPKLEGKGTDL